VTASAGAGCRLQGPRGGLALRARASWLRPGCSRALSTHAALRPAAGELVAAKRGSPMILGIKDSRQQPRTSFSRLRDADDSRWRSSAMECWVASDTSAILEYTKKWVLGGRQGGPGGRGWGRWGGWGGWGRSSSGSGGA
jgi:hypothetical protein